MPGLRTKRRLAWFNGGYVCGLGQDDDSLTGSSGKPRMFKWAFELRTESYWRILNKIGLAQNCNWVYSRGWLWDGLRGSGLEARKGFNAKGVEDASCALATTLPLFYNPGQATWIKWADGSSPSPQVGQAASFWASWNTPSHQLGQGSIYKICL